MSDRLLAFYGDDITGSTDAMDALSRRGVDVVLFLDPPTTETVNEQFGDVPAVGVAGTSRSMTPAEMDEALPPVFEALSELDAPLVHYKICSTFDSSPDIGNVGRAIDLAFDAFDAESVPILPAAPPLGRHVTFGNMFAKDEDDVYRLDRHPTMSEHPVTPMDEGDLRRHLGKQTDRPMGLVDIRAVQNGVEATTARLNDELAADPDIVFFDSLTDEDLLTVGEVTWEQYAADPSSSSGSDPAEDAESAFVVGSSGVEYALSGHWKNAGMVTDDPAFDPLEPVDELFVMSGSAAPVTDTQISTAVAAGFESIRIDTEALVDPDAIADERARVVEKSIAALREGDSVVAYTARGPDDPAIEETKERARALDSAPTDVGRHIGEQQGEILREVLETIEFPRVVVAGGDTCGHVTPALDIYALQSRFPLAAGTPVCRAHARAERFDGLEIALNGGQLGGPEYFVRAKEGADDWG